MIEKLPANDNTVKALKQPKLHRTELDRVKLNSILADGKVTSSEAQDLGIAAEEYKKMTDVEWAEFLQMQREKLDVIEELDNKDAEQKPKQIKFGLS